MDIKYIKTQVEKIKSISSDYEHAHSVEDDLQRDFIKHISKTGTIKQKEMALEILKTDDMDFPRYSA